MHPAEFAPEEQREFLQLIAELSALRHVMLDLAAEGEESIAHLPPTQQPSARNLLHYLALRSHDIRPLQSRLARLGLSSLGRSEAHTLGNLETVLRTLSVLARQPLDLEPSLFPPLRMEDGMRLLHSHADQLLGPLRSDRSVRIMVTMPEEAGEQPELIEQLLNSGMDVMRINTAHGSRESWQHMIAHLRAAEAKLGRSCRILMDLPGPKLRTGPMSPGPQVLRVKPTRDAFGRNLTPARAWLFAEGTAVRVPEAGCPCLPVAGDWLAQLQPGDRVHFRDARERQRIWQVIRGEPGGVLVEGLRTAYLTTGTRLTHRRPGTKGRSCLVGTLPAQELSISLTRGDTLILTREPVPGEPTVRNTEGHLVQPAHIGCSLEEVFRCVQVGQSISLDDGKFLGRVESVTVDHIQLQMVRVRGGTARLRADKGINLPETTLDIPALTARDLADLSFVAEQADLVGYSFVRTPEDVGELQQHLAHLSTRPVGIVLKIETVAGFQHLPGLLLAAMSTGGVGVMIARGDLAVEAGFERLAELQEEILWICEAAHVPVIWATQVLETLAREGIPSRAEITDAAMGTRAECVMLNKGPFIVEALTTLDDILRRMASHQSKKRSMLRRLNLMQPHELWAAVEEHQHQGDEQNKHQQ